MDDLVERLLAAIEAKEARALAVAEESRRWHFSENSDSVAVVDRNEYVACGPWNGPVDEAFGHHIADNDPETVLRRCAADRRVLERHTPVKVDFPDQDHWLCGGCRTELWTTEDGVCPDVRDLADGYGITEPEETRRG